MSSQEIKQEISKVIEEVPESVLAEILGYLKQIQSLPKDKIEMSENLKRILREDKDLLQRLAE